MFHGASWMALFDYAQTDAYRRVHRPAAPDADPDLVAEVKRLRMEAASMHPRPRRRSADFMAAWARYEAARDRLNGRAS